MSLESSADPLRDLLASEFDPAFYQAQVGRALADPLGHFMTEGWRAGLDPSPDFSTRFYLERSPDVLRADMNPLHHYLGWGRREGRAPNEAAAAELREEGEVEETIAPALDVEFYFREHPELALQNVDPVKHYVAFGHDAGFDPTPEFDTNFYLSRSPDVAAAGMNGFHHYLRWGRYEGRAPNPGAIADAAAPATAAERRIAAHVDADFYRAAYPEAARTQVAPFKHYLHFGWHAGLDPSADFSTSYYRSTPYDGDAHENPLHHYLRTGRAQGRLPRPLLPGGVDHASGPAVEAALRPHFDAGFYRAAYSGQIASETNPLSDYLDDGWRAGRDPAPWFSTSDYLRRFPEVAAMEVNPFLHYLLWGREQGFPASDGDGGGRAVPPDPEARIVSAELQPLALQPASPAPTASTLDPSRLDLHWIIPDIEAPGRGGHMTILRMVRWLEAFGHRCTLWINDPNPAWTDADRGDLIQRSYQAVSAKVRSLPRDPQFPPDAVVIATSWTTALVLGAVGSARNRFYFVQDDERAFHPAGAKTLAADRTYRLDMGYLCAGPWLAEMLARDHGRWTRSFDLSPDERQSPPSSRPAGGLPRIAFYARRHTDRRAVELGLLALELLAEGGAAFEAHLFGSEARLSSAPFPAVDHGVLSPEALAELYGACELGLCFSATNHSLIPQEMMACGLPVVELDGESTRAVFPDGVATLAPPDPHRISEVLAALLRDPDARRAQADRAQAWLAGRSWERSARAVEAAMLERLGASASARPIQVRDPAPVATVVIPTLNGGPTFRRVLDQVLAQRTAWPYEVVVVDSGSDDGTWELLRERADVRSVSIARAEFQHGRTRNFAAAHGSGEFIVFITQDAEPADRLWLGDLVGTLKRHPRAAGAFGRHLPRPDASPFTKRDLYGFFHHLDGQPLERSKFLDLPRWRSGDPAFRRELHFFSNNNACLRRAVWERRPFPEVEYGEDQLWAARILAERYALVYAPRAAVIHSHDYDPASRYERSRVEGRWFRDSFGYDMIPSDPEAEIARMNAGDARWGVRNGVSPAEIEAKQRLNAAEIAGLVAGQREP